MIYSSDVKIDFDFGGASLCRNDNDEYVSSQTP